VCRWWWGAGRARTGAGAGPSVRSDGLRGAVEGVSWACYRFTSRAGSPTPPLNPARWALTPPAGTLFGPQGRDFGSGRPGLVGGGRHTDVAGVDERAVGRGGRPARSGSRALRTKVGGKRCVPVVLPGGGSGRGGRDRARRQTPWRHHAASVPWQLTGARCAGHDRTGMVRAEGPHNEYDQGAWLTPEGSTGSYGASSSAFKSHVGPVTCAGRGSRGSGATGDAKGRPIRSGPSFSRPEPGFPVAEVRRSRTGRAAAGLRPSRRCWPEGQARARPGSIADPAAAPPLWPCCGSARHDRRKSAGRLHAGEPARRQSGSSSDPMGVALGRVM